MDTRKTDHLTAAAGAHRLSRRAMARAGGGLASGEAAAGRFGRSASARQADATPEPGQPPSWEEIDQLFAGAAPEATFLAAELIDGRCLPIHAYNTDAVLPVGSTFKFWILGALALEIQAGTIEWEQPVAFNELYRSVPAGDLRYALPGAQYTVRYLAERMMQKSDNTATDVLIYLVGRENVEAMMATMGHHDPSLNIPLMTTREFAFMKLVVSTADIDAYLAASVDERRQILTDKIDPMPYEALAVADNQTVPVELFRVEWFASRTDLANAVTWIWIQSQKEGMRPLLEVIALETQLVFIGEIWPYVGFKGGSEIGLVNGTWLMQRADGHWFIYSIIFADEDAPLDMASIVPVMEAGRDILAVTP